MQHLDKEYQRAFEGTYIGDMGGGYSVPVSSALGTTWWGDGSSIILGTTTGSMLGTAPTQKLGFWGAAPVVRPTALTATASAAPAGGTGTADGAYDTAAHRDTHIALSNNTKTRLDELETKLKTLGLLA